MTLDVLRLIASAGHAARKPRRKVLVIVSARFGRTLRRYASMGYAL